MVKLEQIRNDMSALLEIDQGVHYVDIRSDSIDDALADAAIQLNSKVSHLEFEVLERGREGFLGLMRQPWKIRVYENAAIAVEKKKKKNIDELAREDIFDESNKIIDKDGMFYIRYFGSDINLKVVLPVGEGQKVNLKEVMARLTRKDTLAIDEKLIKDLVTNGTDGKYKVIGQYNHNAAGDASIVVDVSHDEMHATITVSQPNIGGEEISADRISRMLATQGVVVGINDEKIAEFVDNPVYGVPYTVAEGIPPVDGRDAYIAYQFETDSSKIRIKQSDNGQVDFKQLNRIQNVVKGQPLAQKMRNERGKAGKTIYGRYLEAKDGKDINLPLGKNVYVDTDGLTIISSCNGQVFLQNNKICVEEVLTVDGINNKSGNVDFLGTVIVNGNVEYGFSLSAEGNIEVVGTVEGNLNAKGNIFVRGGIQGHNESKIEAGKSLWAKFLNQANVEVGEDVFVNEITNSNVTSKRKIFVKGKHAPIKGGHIFATEEIHAKTIGALSGGSETILTVGTDPHKKRRMQELQAELQKLSKEMNDLELDISTLEDQKKRRRNFPHDKEEILAKNIARKGEILSIIQPMTTEVEEIQTYLRELKVVGKISVSGTIYAGVKVYVRDAYEDIATDKKNVTIMYRDGFVYSSGKYEAPLPEEINRVPDGYSTN